MPVEQAIELSDREAIEPLRAGALSQPGTTPYQSDQGEETTRIESGMEKHVPYSGGNRPEEGSADDRRDRHFTAHLNRCYDEVIAHFRDAESILLFGPGEAKGELEKRLARKAFAKA